MTLKQIDTPKIQLSILKPFFVLLSKSYVSNTGLIFIHVLSAHAVSLWKAGKKRQSLWDSNSFGRRRTSKVYQPLIKPI